MFAEPGSRADVIASALLDLAIAAHKSLKTIRLDNGPDFVGRAIDLWAYQR